MTELPENFDSIFRYIVVVSQRAEQIINGAKVRSQTRHQKPTLGAKDDVDAGLVQWRVLTQEELDAQRQAIVEQFRAQVSAEQEAGLPIPDVLPTAAIPSGEVAEEGEPQERDDELSRLQRLLGMAADREVNLERDDEDDDLEEDLDEEGFALDLDETEALIDDDDLKEDVDE